MVAVTVTPTEKPKSHSTYPRDSSVIARSLLKKDFKKYYTQTRATFVDSTILMAILSSIHGALRPRHVALEWSRLLRRPYSNESAFLAPSANLVKPERQVYMDFQATTPVDSRVLEAMIPCFREDFGNCHSRTHEYGWKAEKLVEDARAQIADLIGAKPKEIIWTSGATESGNLAIKGIAQFYGKTRGKKHLITVQTEHKCILASAQWCETELGWDVTYLPVDKDGLVDPQEVAKAIRPDTALVSVMLINNEIGVIQPVKEIAQICRARGVFMHTDAAQAVGKIPVDVNDLGVDLLSLSGHKMYGPKGIGALYIRGKPRVRLQPQMSGGGQERGLRSGTSPVPLCVGMGMAAKILKEEMPHDLERIRKLAERFTTKLMQSLPGVTLNGSEKYRYPGNCNLSFSCVEGESLLMAIRDVAVSSGSACTSASLEPSYVLRALGIDEALAHTSLRFGIGKTTTEAEVDFVADAVITAVNKLRSLSPLWEAEQTGDKSEMVWT